MLRVYHSNRLDVLEALMEFIVERQRLDDPFKPEMVLVQSTGMAQWLQMTLAKRFGIAANIDFPLPASFIWDMFVRVLSDIPGESAFSKQSMSWKLMTLLPQRLDDEAFALLRHYLSDDSDKRKLFQLAARVADLYDQYLVYRPEWLMRWEADERVDGLGEAQQWQAPLWKALVEHTAELGQPLWHRANLYQRFISALETADEPPAGLPSRVFICGISALPPVYLQALQALGKHVDVYVLFTNPCRYYWGDIKDPAFLAKLMSRQRRHHREPRELPLFRDTEQAPGLFNNDGEQDVGNPLLASWGKLGRDYIYLLAGLERYEELDAFVDIAPDNLLHNLQSDILELRNAAVAGVRRKSLPIAAASACWPRTTAASAFTFAIARSARWKCCHDRLLAMLEENPDLTPRDIIVMVADIDSYSPYIQAVFGAASGERWLPWAISDRRARESHPALQAFITLLSLPDSRFASEDVLALLDVPVLAARFNIDEEGLRYLRQWVNESGVRWGMDDDNVRELDLPATGQHTWRFGLTRMLLGYAMDSSQGEWQSVLPYDESSGLIAELVGNLASLLMQLNLWRRGLAQERPLAEWLPVCRDLLDDFFLPDSETEAALALIEQQWQAAIGEGVQAQYAADGAALFTAR
ncbi:Exodeoxyribonuclease V gamma chain [Raoultella terrigena]|uniref:Exodeoxyribonuclease V gamma chain n=1 Tax=Raoultella terrigena TaxID=577 RepID=A0A4V6J1S9_RAOTE|nr:Exodeoxyribonuclease V gamma chain [Raoultella terrigena]